MASTATRGAVRFAAAGCGCQGRATDRAASTRGWADELPAEGQGGRRADGGAGAPGRGGTAERLGPAGAAPVDADGAVAPASAPATQLDSDAMRSQFAGAAEQAKAGFGLARKGLAGVIDKIDAGTMADIIIKATALQEKTNKALRLKGSPYRIAEISISAAIPPSVSFAISRIDDPEEEVTGEELSSVEILAEAGVPATLEIEGAETTTASG